MKAKITAAHIDLHLRYTGTTSVGDTERLAGINTHDRADRLRVWDKFRNLRSDRLPGEQTDPQCAAVMLECRRIAARMVNAGQMCLVGAAKQGAHHDQL